MKLSPKLCTITRMKRRAIIALATVAAMLVLAGGGGASGAQAAASQPPPSPRFGLPFASPPGVSTWYISQFYGNTPLAYDRRADWYGAGQGLHFGVDFAAKCGTRVVAIGDGRVHEVDNLSHGAEPHNLSILHPGGYVSFYGHLLETPKLHVGDVITRGQPIALTGDPDLTCHSRPHLHLEIRDETMGIAFNPVPLIDADWDTLALFGPFQKFSRDLDNPRRWVTPFDQPQVEFGGPLLNDYSNPWPPENW